MKKIFTLSVYLITCLTGYSHANDDRSILPISLHYNGIGSVYGLGYADTYKKDYTFFTGAITGDVKALGAHIMHQKNKQNRSYALSLAHINEINALTYFSRGTKLTHQSMAYGQKAELSALEINMKTLFASWDWLFKTSFISSTIKGFSDEGRKHDIQTPNIHITPFQQHILGLNIAKYYHLSPHLPHTVHYAIDIQNHSASSGYSGNSIVTLENTWLLEIVPQSQLTLHGFYSSVVAVNKQKLDVKKAFNIECSAVEDASKRIQCEDFRENISSYVSAHNKYGTARNLGGSAYLPAYAENRFRAANSAFLGIALTHSLSDKQWVPKLYFSQETGYASDDSSTLTNEPKHSTSSGLKWHFNERSLVAQYASGIEGEVFSLTIK